MARRIKSRKRKHYGGRTFGYGNTKNKRGKGSRGGVGRGGYHKHRWFHTIKYEGTSQTEPGFMNANKRKIETVKLNDIVKGIENKKYSETGGAYGVDLVKKGRVVKVLGNGPISFKVNVKANAFSASAKEKIEKAGGSVTVEQ